MVLCSHFGRGIGYVASATFLPRNLVSSVTQKPGVFVLAFFATCVCVCREKYEWHFSEYCIRPYLHKHPTIHIQYIWKCLRLVCRVNLQKVHLKTSTSTAHIIFDQKTYTSKRTLYVYVFAVRASLPMTFQQFLVKCFQANHATNGNSPHVCCV